MSSTNHQSKAQTARWYHRAGIWIGIGINPAGITLGAGLASRLDFDKLVWLIPLGVLLLTSLAVLAGLIGRWQKQPFSHWSSETFGVGLGALLINLIMVLGMTGWGGFQMGLMGTGMGNLLGLPWWGGVLVMAVTVFVLLNRGVNRWNWFAWITTLSSLALAAIALVLAWNSETMTGMTPEPFSFSSAVWAIGTIVAFAALFSLRCTDFTWDLASDYDVYVNGAIFFFVFQVALFIGALLFRSTGDSDLAAILASTGWATLGQIFLVVSLLSPALSTPHSGALALNHIIKPFRYWQTTAVLVICSLVLGIYRFDRQLLGFLDWVGAILPPAMAIMILTALLSKRQFSTRLKLTAWLIGAAVALAFKLNDQAVHLVFGALTSFAVLFLGSWFEKKNPKVNKMQMG